MRQARSRAALYSVVSAALLSACGGGGDEFIVIGAAGPFEQPTGQSMQRGVEMAVAEINDKGGIDGRKLQVEWGDDRGDTEQAIRVATKMRTTASVVAVVGHVSSGATLKAAPVYNYDASSGTGGKDELAGTEPLVAISPASSNPDVSRAGEWTFRVVPSDLEHAPVLAAQAQRLGGKRAAILFTNDDYGRGLMSGFAASFARAGGAVVSRDPYLPAVAESTGGLEPYLARALARRPDVLLIAGPANGALPVVQTARRMGFAGPILGGDGLTDLKEQGAAAEGIFVTSAFIPDRADTASRRFVTQYQRRFNGELPNHRGAMAYDAVHLLARVIGEVGPDRAAIRRRLASMQGNDAHRGVTGTIAFDSVGDVQGKEVAMGVIRGGRLVTATR